MKRGDTIPVQVQGVTVTEAMVEAVEGEEVTLVIQGVRVVMKAKITLVDDDPQPPGTLITGAVVTGDESSEAMETINE